MKDDDRRFMSDALAIARRGEGSVEPNPMVGCVIVHDGVKIAEGWHRQFGGPHAEVEALRVAGGAARRSTLFVTLEPCSHQGKTPPCTEAIIQAGIRRVVVALQDPFSQVDGAGLARLQEAGIETTLGVLEPESHDLCAPYLKLIETGRPWVIAKWAMTLDGKIATREGDSRWISGEKSRDVAHALRGRMDAILVGRRTAERDDPLLTARPAGTRVATRIVTDTGAQLSPQSQLAKTTDLAPTLIATGKDAPNDRRRALERTGCEILPCEGSTPVARMEFLLDELGRRRMTNVLVEGGSALLGSLFDAKLVDEVHVWIAPKIVGGRDAPSPVRGEGLSLIYDALGLAEIHTDQIDEDLYLRGRIAINPPDAES